MRKRIFDNMKKTMLLSLACSSIFILTSCGAGGNSTSVSENSSKSTTSKNSDSKTGKSSSSPSSSSSSEAKPIVLPTVTGTDAFYFDGISRGGEGDAANNPGRFYEWHGDGGNVYSFTKSDKDKGFVIEYYNTSTPNSETGWGWYGCQFFYKLPYAVSGDSYRIVSIFDSDAAGEITINGRVISLNYGETLIDETFVRGETDAGSAPLTFSMQLGQSQTGFTTLNGSILKMKNFMIYDEVNTYHEVKFTNGNELVKDIQVREGFTVAAPKVEAPEGKILKGWYQDEVKWSSELAIDKSYSFAAVFADVSEGTHTVTVKKGDSTVGSVVVLEGETTDFSSIEAPWGYTTSGFYSDSACKTAFDLSTPINEDITVYGLYRVNPIIWIQSEEAGYTFHDEVSYLGDGALHLAFNGWGSAGWHVQVNFNLPVGEIGNRYKASFDYKLNSEGGDYKIFDGADITNAVLMEQSDDFVTGFVEYDGGMLSGGNKLTIELGAIPASVEVDFTLTNLVWTELA